MRFERRLAVQTIEKTSKGLKLQILIGVLMILGGLVGAALATGSGYSGNGILVAVLGLGLYLVTRIRIWWNHG